jgi:hypothetical protein
LIFGNRRAALNGEPGVAADGGGQQLREQRFSRTRLADQHQAAPGRQRDQHPLDGGRTHDHLAADVASAIAKDKRARRRQA